MRSGSVQIKNQSKSYCRATLTLPMTTNEQKTCLQHAAGQPLQRSKRLIFRVPRWSSGSRNHGAGKRNLAIVVEISKKIWNAYPPSIHQVGISILCSLYAHQYQRM